MERIIKIIRSKSGSALLLGCAACVLILSISCAIFEYYRWQIITLGVRDAVQTTLITSCTNNYDKLYGGVREGYSGGYKLDDAAWTENVDTGNFYNELDGLLGLQEEGSKHLKYYSGKNVEEFTLSNLKVEITNAPLAPIDGEGRQFKGVAYVDIEIPLSFGWQGLPPFTFKQMEITAGYSAIF